MNVPLDFIGGVQVAYHPVGFLGTILVLGVGLVAIGLAAELTTRYGTRPSPR
jgi:hypothetical protein